MIGRFWVYFIIKFKPDIYEVNDSEWLGLPFRDICSLIFYTSESIGVTGIIYVIFKNHAEDYKENHQEAYNMTTTNGNGLKKDGY